MKNIQKTLTLATITAVFGCTREKEDCKPATVRGKIKHHALIIPNGMVYIKYGTNDAPQDPKNPNSYDDSAKVDASGNYTMVVKDGTHYIYGIGHDSAIAAPVYGGFPITIVCKEIGETLSRDVAVVE